MVQKLGGRKTEARQAEVGMCSYRKLPGYEGEVTGETEDRRPVTEARQACVRCGYTGPVVRDL